ncbi:LacI family DNA-binding transcriptional regulator [Kiritimatiellota bacterium B12222]|nr:LacI family DNA-binding transcriptional regulator [Kiritimatiellota bacterium B12222]
MNIVTFSEKAGVSVATVSRALNPKTAHIVKPETRRRIQDLAAQLHFTPHPGARILRGTSMAPIAILLRNKDKIFLSEYYARLMSGMMHAAAERKQVVHAIAFQPDYEEDFNEQLTAATVGCGGIIYLSDTLTARMLIGLERLHQPFVTISSCLPMGVDPSDLTVPVFGTEEKTGGYMVTEHLIELGHQHIAHLNGPANRRDVRDRREGFEAAMADHQRVVRSDWCFNEEFTFESGVAAADYIFPLLEKVTAVVCGNDEQALGLIRGLATKGVSCPERVSVTGFDDALWASRHSPALTTIRQPWLKMADASVRMIHELHLKDGMKKNSRELNLFTPELIVRETTAAPRG